MSQWDSSQNVETRGRIRIMVVKNPLFLVFLILAFSLSISSVYAADDENQVDLDNFPARLAEAFNVDVFAGQMLASNIIMLMFLLPVAMFARKNILAYLFMGFTSMGLCVALGYLPYWFLLVVVIIVALMFSGKMRDLISGGN